MTISALTVSVYTVPTDAPEADGTLDWNSTTIVLVEIEAGNKRGMGYTYAHEAAGQFIRQKLAPVVTGKDAFDIPARWLDMAMTIRNEGSCGMAYMALSAVDNALWDLKAKLLDLPLCVLLGKVRDKALVYGSGGFTSYSHEQLQRQLGDWAEDGLKKVKMKIGRDPKADVERVKTAREAIGPDVDLMVDANGAYDVKTALAQAETFVQQGVTWLEEPVSSDNLNGLAFIRNHAPASIQIAAGEYGYSIEYFAAMLHYGAVDVLQADATRCGGITGFLKTGYLTEAEQLPYSFHCAPALHLHPSLALNRYVVGEYFHDHARIENLFFDGVQKPVDGYLSPDLSRPGLGLELKKADAEKFKV
ncbi:enolase C-terminal domain-like protein [Spirosoma spitsbergense]|uniref:enolase C-terminal domain-like protein n=1 Tax=Spirosoma spitsbergense TaxID=431554 RepID=UPI0003686090|nr:enolase C-terminal domain-like protein [Spirosoma spitsbergense]